MDADGNARPPAPGIPPVGPWVEQWLSAPRFVVYVAAADGDSERALALYEWNAQISAALLRDLAHLEVGLRNAYDRALVVTARCNVRGS